MERLENRGKHELYKMGKNVSGFSRANRIISLSIDRNNTVDLDIDIVDKGYKGVEPLGNGGAAAEGSDVGDLVEDDEDEGVGDPVELVLKGNISMDS